MIASATTTRSLTGSCAHTFRLAVLSMFCPPGDVHSLEGSDQFFNSRDGQ
jgi:hypothetical protein